MEHLFGLVGGFSHYFVHFVIVLSVVVFIHEFGHYWVARRCGVRVEQFSIGFGPEIFGWNDRHGTRWKFSVLPLGGFVKMFGDSDPSSFKPDEKVQAFTEEDKKVAFYSQPVGKRAAIVAAGPAANYIFAIIVLAFLFV
ncbi:MAG: RIP metalloprotease, partial [Proteobacteria bacterium]|nr:RIP metalloprotease [Pseudomonadota bacterium]